MPLVPQGREIPCASDGLAPPCKRVLELDVNLGKVTRVGLLRTVADLVLEVVLLVRDVEVVLLVGSVEVVLLVCGVDVLILITELVTLVRGVAEAIIVDLATVDILQDDVLVVTLALN